ncbi:recombinase family protein [Acinetobacter haemolyticus]|nr:recombinase family protein [Acinetobacter haemolyticus]
MKGTLFCTATLSFALQFRKEVQLGQNAAIYCRVSTNDQSCERQEYDLRAYANRCGYDVVGVWKETASGSKDERLQRKYLMTMAQSREIDAILVTELTRWGRSTVDLVQSLQDLGHFGYLWWHKQVCSLTFPHLRESSWLL